MLSQRLTLVSTVSYASFVLAPEQNHRSEHARAAGFQLWLRGKWLPKHGNHFEGSSYWVYVFHLENAKVLLVYTRGSPISPNVPFLIRLFSMCVFNALRWCGRFCSWAAASHCLSLHVKVAASKIESIKREDRCEEKPTKPSRAPSVYLIILLCLSRRNGTFWNSNFFVLVTFNKSSSSSSKMLQLFDDKFSYLFMNHSQ